jgi:hypothetical protein
VVQLPENIKNSKIFTINQLQLLTDVDQMPTVEASFEDETVKNIFQYYSLMPEEMDTEIHRYAGKLLNEGKINEAWQVLLTTNVW